MYNYLLFRLFYLAGDIVEVVCPKCGYSWKTKSRLRYITCPCCHRKFLNPVYETTTTTTTTTETTTTTSLGTTEPNSDPANQIKVWVADVPEECYKDLKELAEEVSSPDPLGVEVLVVDSEVAEEVFKYHGVELNAC